jgi:phosphoribosylanthranilate isomerase
MRTRVKICGFKHVEDALFAANLGVDAVGLVFYPPSPRNVKINQAIEIVNAVPAFVSVVALFVDEHEAVIRNVLEHLPIDCIQFHGEESPDACRVYGKRYIKAVRMRENTDIAALASAYNDADGLLLDAYQSGAKGGTGNQFDWALIPKTCQLPIILAGGLDSTNAHLAIRQVQPYALDVSSSVEAAKGVKNKEKMAAFIAAVHQGDRIIT